MSEDTVKIIFTKSDLFHLWCVLMADLAGDACDSAKARTQDLLDIVNEVSSYE